MGLINSQGDHVVLRLITLTDHKGAAMAEAVFEELSAPSYRQILLSKIKFVGTEHGLS